MKILRTLVNFWSVIKIILRMMLKSEVIVIPLENIEDMHIYVLMSMLT